MKKMANNKKSILIVEDNPADIRLIKEFLLDESKLTYNLHNLQTYNLECAKTLKEALYLIPKESFEIILLDLSLPDSNGFDALKKIVEKNPYIPVVIFTVDNNYDVISKALSLGVQDYLVKGQFDSSDLVRSINYSIERKKIETERILFSQKLQKVALEWNSTFDAMEDAISIIDLEGKILRANKATTKLFKKSFNEIIGNTCNNLLNIILHPEDICPLKQAIITKKREIRVFKVDNKFLECKVDPILDEDKNIISFVHIISDVTEQKILEQNLKESLSRIKILFEQTVMVLGQLMEAKDPYTAGHQKNVADIAVKIAKGMNLEESRVEAIRLASLIHDIGKITVPASILSKPGKISEIERAMIETHPKTGYEIIRNIDFPKTIGKIILQHHERLNGSGYPNHLKSDEIILEAKIVAVADVVDAMLSHRPYRQAKTFTETIEEISKNKGILYDTSAVNLCIKILNEQRSAKN